MLRSRRFEPDPRKDAANRRKHGISLSAAADFDWDTLAEYGRRRDQYGRDRITAVGILHGRLWTLVFSYMGSEGVQPISLRHPSKHERKWYNDDAEA
jgi:uncharacterized protein